MSYLKKILPLVFLFTLIPKIEIYAHSGRTDSQGGHNDHINGGYHFHHGEGPHQHPNGICPYNNEGGISSPVADVFFEYAIAVVILTLIVVFIIDQGNQRGRSFKEYIIRRFIQVAVFVALVQLIKSLF